MTIRYSLDVFTVTWTYLDTYSVKVISGEFTSARLYSPWHWSFHKVNYTLLVKGFTLV